MTGGPGNNTFTTSSTYQSAPMSTFNERKYLCTNFGANWLLEKKSVNFLIFVFHVHGLLRLLITIIPVGYDVCRKNEAMVAAGKFYAYRVLNFCNHFLPVLYRLRHNPRCSTDYRPFGWKVYKMDVFGPIPDALWSLTYLMGVNIEYNYLTGQLSPSIGNLTRMKYLSIGVNALSGQLPKELGLLTDLIFLGFGVNYFSGSLPSELGNLTKLERVFIDSAGVSGEIPQTFSKLQSMTDFWAPDNELNGRIPEFIGNWTKLTGLGLWGNNFQGSIPSTISNLAAIQHLRITRLANGISSLAFIKNMTSLRTLILSNNNITDTIPSSIINNQQLSLLDLSFNNLYSEIPVSLFTSLRSLTDLFLGNNRLTGSLPERKLSSLVNIDLSYNYLSGSFPMWANSMSLQLNLVSNNFTTKSLDNSVHPSGLECLQRNFPCNRGTGIYSDFAINCGGPQIRSSKNVVFESDLAPLGRATYYMKDTRRWAVSTAGYAIDTNTPYIASTSSQITNTVDQELFQTARLSAGSLRYFGLGLENGNYSLSLQFAESVLVDMANSWKSLGRRRFDVYIQGNRVLQNFDIMKEAGGFASSAVKRDFTALVTENYIEIHLFWDGKGTNRVADFGYYGPLISAISAIPNFGPNVSNKVPSPKSRDTGMIVGIVVAVVAVLTFSVLAVICIIIRNSGDNDNEELELLGVNARPYTFTYSELRTATEDFSPANKLGEGGFGSVYKGKLNDGKVIAVKQLSVGSHQGKTQFYAEIAIISAVQHRNLVKLHGCCVDGARRMLVYEYLDNNSLDQAIFGAKSLDLNWQTRLNICMGIARGLAYLHEESRIRIVHRDVKASNILLDAELNPKISDFGLAKLYDDKMTHISTGVAGTIGYLAPEYAMRGHLTEKVDIFGFGVIALEIVSGRPNTATYLEEEKVYLMEWVWEMHESDRDLDLVDPRLLEFNIEEVKRVIGIALLCTQTSPAMRPAMSRVVAMLSGDAEVNPVLSKPMYLTDWKFTDSSTQMNDI
ncbi:hypothetical protein QQ045_001898 [Rhodiola kirilowii]